MPAPPPSKKRAGRPQNGGPAIAKTAKSLRSFLRGCSRPLVLVPTMGALHAGHAALIRRARCHAKPGGTVAVSIFVNPSQFGEGEDLDRYPRPVKADIALCRECGADLVYLPEAGDVYAADHSTWVGEDSLSSRYCGASRPGHFRGVCTVVAKLFNLFQPDAAVFGQKDYQQLAVIRRMVRDLDFQVRIIAVPTVRERDGLALSSRNSYLGAEERLLAPALRKALLQGAAAARNRAAPEEIRKVFLRVLDSEGRGAFRLDYFDVADARTLVPAPPGRPVPRPAVLLAAACLGKTRLIDNFLIP